MLIAFKCIKGYCKEWNNMSLLFVDANAMMSANKISDNIPISKRHDKDSEALELICLSL